MRRNPWLWLLVVGLLALIFYQYVPRTEIHVLWHPWFLDQVKNDSIKSLSIQGAEIRGELRTEQPYQNPSSRTVTTARKF